MISVILTQIPRNPFVVCSIIQTVLTRLFVTSNRKKKYLKKYSDTLYHDHYYNERSESLKGKKVSEAKFNPLSPKLG